MKATSEFPSAGTGMEGIQSQRSDPSRVTMAAISSMSSWTVPEPLECPSHQITVLSAKSVDPAKPS